METAQETPIHTLPAMRDESRHAGAVAIRPTSIDDYLQLADRMADSDLVPSDFKGKPANCLIAMQMGAELGLAPMQALSSIAVINGRAAIWGDGLLALLLQSSAFDHAVFAETWEGQADTLTAVCTMSRKGGVPATRKFGASEAKTAKLLGKAGPWSQYPKRMMQMRARAWCARDLFSDVLRGFNVAEEYIGVEDAQVVSVETVASEKPKSRTDAVKEKLAARSDTSADSENGQQTASKALEDRRDGALAHFAKLGVSEDRVLATLGVMGPEAIGIEQLDAMLDIATAIKSGRETVESAFPAPLPHPIQDTQMKALHAIGKRKNLEHDDLHRLAKEAYGVESMNDLSSAQASELLASLQG